MTFEGLRQITYEPTERVALSEMRPERKSEYLVIDRIGDKQHPDFGTQVIPSESKS